ncbi:MAG: heme-copper oxidase subunit III [Chloroflexi bacterium]|nr:heme-copper oxidase subunit III [Chloroflexota bacterium]MBI5702767.1 heme-copper oxidase subunit III [Chloroflexota bacterium]
MLNQGVFIFVYLAILTVLEFLVAASFNSTAVLIAVALVKGALVVYYYMHVYKLSADHEGDHNSYEYKTGTNRLGLWLFLISDAFVFGGLLVMRMNLLGLTRPHLNQLLGLGVTSILLISSFFMNRGETMIAHGDRKGFLNNTLITFLLGLGFLIGVVFVEWRLAAHEGLTPSSGAAGAVFYMMTGMHAFHVLTGLVFLAIVWINGRRGLYDEKHYPVEAAAVYWHFVDVVWIVFYPALYLVGTAIV